LEIATAFGLAMTILRRRAGDG